MAAQKLSDLGLRVALIEKQTTLASGPSTRNEVGFTEVLTTLPPSVTVPLPFRSRDVAFMATNNCGASHPKH